MAMDQSALLELLEALKATDVGEHIRVLAERAFQELIDAEASAVIGAEPWERTDQRTAVRNGTRARVLATTAGDLELRIPKLRSGVVLPVTVGASPAHRPDTVRGGDGGLPALGVHPQGR